jgi:hypothetical protein
VKHRRLIQPLALFALAAVLLAWAASNLGAYPEPAIVPKAWELTFTHGDLRPVAVADVNGVTHWYWYLPYKVVNNTKEERLFVPDVAIATDAGDLIQAGKDVPANVFPEIKRRLNNHLLEDPVQVVGRILIGEDNAKESVIVWPVADHAVGNLTILIGGLSGETQVALNPATSQPALTTKTKAIEFDFPGRAASPQDQVVTPKGDSWVMR